MTRSQGGTTPEDLGYTRDHEWARVDGARVKVGITAFAATALGDVVHLELPAIGSPVISGEPCGEIESTKSVSELYSPASGIVSEVNAAAVERPELVNEDPFGVGWLFIVVAEEAPRLLSADEYREVTEAEA